ncbi:MAG TPA: GMC family oxidoreductase [Naasia sp.]
MIAERDEAREAALTRGADVVIVGSGAGGSTMFKELTAAGLDVLLLEEGEEQIPGPTGYGGPISELTAALYRGAGVTPIFGLPPIAFAEGRALGGTTEINGGLFWRTPEWILDDWRSQGIPLQSDRYDDLFTELETGLRVGYPALVPGMDRDSELLHEGAEHLGWNVVRAPRLIPGCMSRNQCGSGCASGAKQSMSVSYIPMGKLAGGRVVTEARALRVEHDGGVARTLLVEDGATGARRSVPFRHLVVAGGAVQTPVLLRRSRMSARAGKRIGFHLNAKFLAVFPEDVNAQNGTMFNWQIQEYMKQGRIIMGTNYRPEYVSLAASTWTDGAYREWVGDYSRAALYTSQVRPQTYGTVMAMGDTAVPVLQLRRPDLHLLELGARETLQALFAAGATSVALPHAQHVVVTSPEEGREALAAMKTRDWSLSSVHAMASCSMGTGEDAVVDVRGRLSGFSNVTVADASILPSTIGESPQGTIMAIVTDIARDLAERLGGRVAAPVLAAAR